MGGVEIVKVRNRFISKNRNLLSAYERSSGWVSPATIVFYTFLNRPSRQSVFQARDLTTSARP
jgi:hypothetical protein